MLILYITIISIHFKKKWSLILLLVVIIIFSNPIVSRICISYLEKEHPPINLETLPKFGSIVVLSGMVRTIITADKKIEYEFNESFDRIYAAIKLVKLNKTDNIILTSGKMPWSLGMTKAEFLKKYLIENGVKSENIILTSQVYNTAQEAEEISKILNINEKFGLITSSFHMPRALKTFKAKNLNAYPIPVDFRTSHSRFTLLNLVPSSQSLSNISLFIREMMGRFYYSLIN